MMEDKWLMVHERCGEKAMTELYDNVEELTFPDAYVSIEVPENDRNVRKDGGLADKMSDKLALKDRIRKE